MSNLEKAKDVLRSGAYTCVFVKGDTVETSVEKGVTPLIKRLESGKNLTGYSAADKVVGKGAAFLYVLLKVQAVYADVISTPAKEVLIEHKIKAEYKVETAAIRNRKGDGFCPIETAVKDISEPNQALIAIKNKIKEMQK